MGRPLTDKLLEVCFEDERDLPGQIRRFLDDADARRSISTAARGRIAKQHTYQHRARQMLDALRTQ